MKSRIAFALPAALIVGLMAAYVLSTGGMSGVLHAAKPVPVDTTKKNAQIKIDEDSYDFHDIEQGTKAEHQFMISNPGTDTLVIASTRPSCGCTAAVLDAKDNRIPPGASTRLKVTFDANNKPEGPIMKSVTITSNAKNTPDAMVHIQGRVVKSKMAHKTMMHLDGLFQGRLRKLSCSERQRGTRRAFVRSRLRDLSRYRKRMISQVRNSPAMR